MDEFENVGDGAGQGPKIVSMVNQTENDLAARDPLVPEWARVRFEAGLWFAFQCLCLCLMVIIGTALGNGVPMARSTGEAFKIGVQAGLKSCPCANKSATGPTPLPAAALKPVAEPTPISLKPVSEVVK